MDTIQNLTKALLHILALVLETKGDWHYLNVLKDLWAVPLPVSKTDILIQSAENIWEVEELKKYKLINFENPELWVST